MYCIMYICFVILRAFPVLYIAFSACLPSYWEMVHLVWLVILSVGMLIFRGEGGGTVVKNGLVC